MDILEGYLHTCPICGKEFWARSMWVYQRRDGAKQLYLCSWRCMRKFDKARMLERGRCPFCESPVRRTDLICPGCGKEIRES